MMTNIPASDATRLQILSRENQPVAMIARGPNDPLLLAPVVGSTMPTLLGNAPTGIFKPLPAPADFGTPAIPATSQGLFDWLKNTLMPLLQKMLGSTAPLEKPDPVVAQRYERRSAYAADILAGDANLWKDGAKLDAAKLQDIVDHPENNEPDTVRAAQILLNHPQQLSKIIGDTADGGITPQQLIDYSKNVTLKTPPAVNNANNPSRAWRNSADAADILSNDANLWKNKSYLDVGDLKDIANHPDQHSPETVHAARVMLQNLPQFSLADGINTDGARDGEIWRGDLAKFATTAPVTVPGIDPPIDMGSDDYMRRALAAVAARAQLQQAPGIALIHGDATNEYQATLARQSLLTDSQLWQGKTTLTTQDLSTVLNNPYAYNPATVSAALYMLQHPEAFHDAAPIPVDPAVALQAKLDMLLAQLNAESDLDE